jgi:AraC family transcriptional regulator
LLVLGHGEFLGEEVRRTSTTDFVATYRKSRSAARDAEPHQHDGPHIILPLDEGYWSDAEDFEPDCLTQLVYTPAQTIHRDSMIRLGGRYLCASFPARIIDDVEISFRDPVAVKRASLVRIAHVLTVQILRGEVDELVVEDACWRLVSALSAAECRHRPPWIKDAVSFCRESLGTPIRIADIGNAIGLNSAHVSRTFRTVFGCSLSRYVATLRLEAAAAELRRGKQSIAETAANFGYADQSHLCRTFRSTFGVPPSVYRAAFQ